MADPLDGDETGLGEAEVLDGLLELYGEEDAVAETHGDGGVVELELVQDDDDAGNADTREYCVAEQEKADEEPVENGLAESSTADEVCESCNKKHLYVLLFLEGPYYLDAFTCLADL